MRIVDLCKKRKKMKKLDAEELEYNVEKLDFFRDTHFIDKFLKINKDVLHCYVVAGTQVLHRKSGPAIVMKDGSEAWFQFGMLHRENGEAVSGCFRVGDPEDLELYLFGDFYSVTQFLKITKKENLMAFM